MKREIQQRRAESLEAIYPLHWEESLKSATSVAEILRIGDDVGVPPFKIRLWENAAVASGREGIRQSISAPRKLACIGTFLGLLLGTGGCSMLKSGADNLVCNPWEFPHNYSLHRMESLNRKRAAGAWRQLQATEFPVSSSDFEAGFLEGYADYLTYGGDGRPPLLAPRRYWRQSRSGPVGQTAQYEWFAGFEQGVRSADLSGERHQLTAAVESHGRVEGSTTETILPAETEGSFRNEDEPDVQTSGQSRLWGTLLKLRRPDLTTEPESDVESMRHEVSEGLDSETESQR